jgi:hypothetical protein
MCKKQGTLTLWLIAGLEAALPRTGSAESGLLAADVHVCGEVFDGVGKVGDFNWMVQQPEYKDTLFVFNDNTGQFDDHRKVPNVGPGCDAGGGNAIIRPYQCKDPPRALGIPTGPGFDKLTPEAKAYIDKAVDQIAATVRKYTYARVIYNAADASGRMGTHIFPVGDDVKDYIVARLQAIAAPAGNEPGGRSAPPVADHSQACHGERRSSSGS